MVGSCLAIWRAALKPPRALPFTLEDLQSPKPTWRWSWPRRGRLISFYQGRGLVRGCGGASGAGDRLKISSAWVKNWKKDRMYIYFLLCWWLQCWLNSTESSRATSPRPVSLTLGDSSIFSANCLRGLHSTLSFLLTTWLGSQYHSFFSYWWKV